MEIKVNDSQAKTSTKKHERSVNSNSLKRRMIDLRKEYEDSMIEDGNEDDVDKGESEDGNDEFMDPKDWY